MKNARGLTKNPIGIIALFISLIYAFACLVLNANISNLNSSVERLPLIWFIIIYPLAILIGFVFLVVKHHEKLYAPSDYSDESAFTKTFSSKYPYNPITAQTDKNQPNQTINFKKAMDDADNTYFNKVRFSDDGKKNLDIAYEVSDSIDSLILSKYFKAKFLESRSFGVQAPEYYLTIFNFRKELLKKNMRHTEEVIIRITKDSKGEYAIIGIGKGIVEYDPKKFAKKLIDYLNNKILPSRIKEE